MSEIRSDCCNYTAKVVTICDPSGQIPNHKGYICLCCMCPCEATEYAQVPIGPAPQPADPAPPAKCAACDVCGGSGTTAGDASRLGEVHGPCPNCLGSGKATAADAQGEAI